ncbi:MAG: RES domain-containing protein [Spirochaetota bacterium]|nr:RES domain-containing protein [Spirochaetota bacterium]
MTAYRLSHARHAQDISGFGAYKAGGRWNSKGYYTLYLSEHPCGAILESLIHMPPHIIPDNYSIVTFHISEKSKIKTVEESELPLGWCKGGYDLALFQRFGKEHLFEKKLMGLKIHSSVAYPSYNLILNPEYKGFTNSIKIIEIKPYVFDPRLMQLFKI